MKTKLSSGGTIFMKTVPPLVFGGVTLLALVIIVINPKEADADTFSFLLGPLPFTVFVCWCAGRLKWVSVDEQALYVGGWTTEIAIPLTQIEKVDELMGGRPVIVRLKVPSAFGRRILFLAPYDPFLIFNSATHPVTRHLRDRVKIANSTGAI